MNNKFKQEFETEFDSYESQAEYFLEKTESTLEIMYNRFGKSWNELEQNRNIFDVVLKNNQGTLKFEFSDSVVNSCKHLGGNKYSKTRQNTPIKIPTTYDILSCLNVNYLDNVEDIIELYGFEFVENIQPEYYDNEEEDWDVLDEIIDQDVKLREMYSETEIELLNEIN